MTYTPSLPKFIAGIREVVRPHSTVRIRTAVSRWGEASPSQIGFC